jgi:hypothetical protein
VLGTERLYIYIHTLNKNKKKKVIVTTATLFTMAFFVVATTATVMIPLAYGKVVMQDFVAEPKAPMAASQDGNNVYVV